jgi:hypothetical protein
MDVSSRTKLNVVTLSDVSILADMILHPDINRITPNTKSKPRYD